MNKKLLILFLLVTVLGSSQSDNVFIENKGQWDERIAYNQLLADGNLFLEKDGFTYSLFDKTYINELHHDKTTPPPSHIKSHAIKTKFLNCNEGVQLKKLNESSFYYNYFLGNDKSKWKSYVRSTSKVAYEELYKGIDLVIYHQEGITKYDYIVKPNGNINDIQVNYAGADSLYIVDGKLVIKNTISDFQEAKPYAYQLVNGKEVEVPCSYQLTGTVLSFDFPKGYDKSKELIIDPVVVFSSFTGSTADNFGFTATYDNAENTYVGGIVYGTGIYPTTTGAFQTAFNTSAQYYVDIAISKFNVNGTNLLYSTYIGGSRSEAPHSLVVNDQDELFIFGTSGSNNYPVTATGYDTSFSGGASVSPLYSGIYYYNGSDIIITKLNVNGTALLGSTYVGGTANDGVNTDTQLAYNYGDAFRGEIVIDTAGNPIIATTTNSTNFPITAGAPQATYGGGFSDACVFKLNANLTNLTWSTFHGGSLQDAGYGVQYDSKGDIFVTGGTRSTNLVTSLAAYDRTHNGLEDGFITKFNILSNAISASTYIGTSSYDQSYFVQVDIFDNVYVTGQCLGNYPVTGAVYSNPNSKQFFHKLSNDLDTSFWSTVVGSGRNSVDFSPSAFLVNDCGLIYLSGWGGVTNTYYRATGSSTAGLPTTSDGFQLTTDNSDFYLMVLDREAASLRYGTYFGGNVSNEHVDGGTSRFDKKGNVYQAVCAGCGGHSDLPTTPGAWSRTNNSTNCNLGVIKMNIAYIQTIASLPVPYLCLPDSVSFINNSSGGNTYKWYFGDGDSSSQFQPTHVYADTGLYTVTLIVSDSVGCVPPDTAVITLNAYKPKALSIDTTPVICPGDSVQLQGRNGQTYLWSPSATLSNDTISNPIAFPLVTTTYQLVSDYYCNSDTIYTTVVVDTNSITIKPDTTICSGSSITLWAQGGASYNWYPSSGMLNSTSSTPTVTPSVARMYYVDVTSSFGCVYTDSVYVDFHSDTMSISPDTSICLNQSVQLSSTGGGSYNWSPIGGTSSSVTVRPSQTTTYQVSIVSPNGCNLTDSVTVHIFNDPHTISPDTAICPGESAQLRVTGGGSYQWVSNPSLSSLTSSTPTASPSTTTSYQVLITSPNGCLLYDTVEVAVNIDTIRVKPDTTICSGSSITLWAQGGASYNWYPSSGMLNPTSSTPTVTPSVARMYYVDVTSSFGCVYTDSVYVDFHSDTMSISPDTSICLNQSVQLSSTGGGSYNWSPIGGTSSSVTVRPSQTTTYQVSIVSPNGCNLTDSVTVHIFNDPHTISPDTAICPGESAQLRVTGGGSYQWVSNPSLSSLTSSTPTASPSTTTSYQVLITSPNGCLLYDTVEVAVNIDTIRVKPDTTICSGSSITLWAQGGASYNWYPSSGMLNSTSSTPTVTPSVARMYYVDVTSSFGCVYTDSVYVDFHSDTMSISPDTSICLNQSVQLSSTGGGSYNWSPIGGTSSSVTVRPSQTTTYQVSIVSPNGCNLTDSVTVHIFNDPHTISPDTAICPGESAQLRVTGGGSYQWVSNPSLSSLTSSTPTASPSTTTSYQVLITSPNGCLLYDTVEVAVNIDTIRVKPDTTICSGSSITLWAQGGASYNWYPSSGMLNPTSSTPTVTPSVARMYYVDVTSSFGCVYTDSVYVDFHSDTMSISPDTSICLNQSVQLSSTGGGSYNWSPIGGTSSSITVRPSQMTTYQVSIVSPNGCNLTDSVTVNVSNDSMSIIPDTTLCLGSNLQLFASGGGSYNWGGGPIISGSSSASPIVSPTTTTQYKVQVVTPAGCYLTDSVTVLIHDELYGTGPDATICANDTAQLYAYGGVSYRWSPSGSLNNSSVNNPLAFPGISTQYLVTLITPKGCVKTDSVLVNIDTNRVYPVVTNDTIVCNNNSVVLNASGGNSYAWSPAGYLSSPNSATTTAVPVRTTTFYVDVSNRCFTARDSVRVTIPGHNSIVIPDDTVCRGETTTIVAAGAVSYQWNYDNSIISGRNSSVLVVKPTQPTFYKVNVIDGYGCKDSTVVYVGLHAQTKIDAGNDVILELGENTVLKATGGQGSVVWSPSNTLGCPTCRTTQAFPEFDTEYVVELTDNKGCKTQDSVLVQIAGIIRVPNTFTPNGDGHNDIFYANGVNILTFKMEIFNRWGELIYFSDDISKGWDGFYNGKLSQVDTYVWRVTYTHLTQEQKQLMGHVNLIK